MSDADDVRAAFWQGWEGREKPEPITGGPLHGQYNATIRTEFSAFVDMLARDGHISDELAQTVTL